MSFYCEFYTSHKGQLNPIYLMHEFDILREGWIGKDK